MVLESAKRGRDAFTTSSIGGPGEASLISGHGVLDEDGSLRVIRADGSEVDFETGEKM